MARIVELARDLRAEIVEIRGAALWEGREARAEPFDEAYRRLLQRPDARVLVGTIDETVMGFGVGELETLHDGRLLGVVSDLYVEPGVREVGVGEVIVDDLLAWFSNQGCVGADAWALPGHRMTKNFFEEHGFVSRLIVVHHPLPPGGSAS